MDALRQNLSRLPPWLVYLLISLALTWPLARDPAGQVAGGARTDAVNAIWSIWFAEQALSEGRLPLQTHLLNHPFGGRLVVADPLNALIGYPLAHAWGPATAYALLVIAHLCFAGAAAHALGKRLGGGGWVAGIGFMVSPLLLSHVQNGSSEAVAAGWLPLSVLWLVRAVEEGGAARIALAGIGLLLAAIGGGWYAGIGAFLVAGGMLLWGWRDLPWRLSHRRLLPALLLGLSLAAPAAVAIKSVAGAVSFDAKTVITGLIATKAVPRTLSYKEVDEDRGLQPFYDPRTETLKEYDTQAFLGYIDTALVAGLPLGEGSGGTVSDGDEDEGAVPTRPQGSIPKTMIPGAEGQRVGPILNWANTKGWEDIGLTVNDVELVGPASSGIAWLVGTKDPRKARGRAAAVPWVASVITSTGATAYVKLPSDFTGSGVRLKELSLAKTPSGSRIFVGGSKIAVIDGASRALITTIDLLPDTPFNNSNGASIIDMAVSPDGKYLFALNSDSDPARKLFFVIDIATNAVLKTLTLDTLNGTGYASDMAVSTDGKRVYITTDSSSGAPYSASILSEIDLYAPAPTGTATIGTPEVSTGVVAGRVTTSGLGGSMTYTPTTPAKGTVSITNAGAFTFTPSAAAMHAAARNGAATAEKTDTFTVTVRDSQGSRVDVPVTVTIVPRNTPPADVRASVGSPDTSTGVVTGTVSATDADRDSLTFSVPATTARGGITINAATGAFSYTPTLAARQNAGKPGATAADKSDSFTVTVSDGYGGSRSTAVAVAISPVAPPANSPPVPGTPTTTTNTSTGVVSGKVNATDPNGDSVTYTATTISTAKGRVTVTGAGTFTYTPTAAARHAAARSGSTSADKADTFTVTASDGRGASAGIPVTVTVSPKNTAPSGVRATVGTPNTTTGVVTGRVSATDADRDPLTFSAPATTSKGAISITASSGAFTYTPTLAARQNAGRPGAGTADRSDSFIVTIADGYGGSARVTVSVTIRPA